MADFVKLCKDGRLEEVRAALAMGQDVNSRDGHNHTGLMLALYRGHNSVVELLLSQPSLDVNTSNSGGNTALHWATSNVTGLRLLLAHPRLNSINARGWPRSGETPLMRAVGCGSVEAVRELVRVEGVDLETRDDLGRSLEMVAWEEGGPVR